VITLDRRYQELDPYSISLAGGDIPPARENTVMGDIPVWVRQTTGWIAENLTQVSIWRDSDRYVLDIREIGRFSVARNGTRIQTIATLDEVAPHIISQTVLGPPLVLALALQGVWCLHASAVRYGEQAIAIMGESGSGKSTLAEYANRLQGTSRVADDIFPIACENGALHAYPYFPQLKFPPEEQPALGIPHRIPVQWICILRESGDSGEISIQRLSTREAALALVRHTVASRLFDRALLAQHFEFCVRAAIAVGFLRLSYPRQYHCLPDVWQAIVHQINEFSQV
jgi:hypothetical protein